MMLHFCNCKHKTKPLESKVLWPKATKRRKCASHNHTIKKPTWSKLINSKYNLIWALLGTITSERLEFLNLQSSTVGVISVGVLAGSSKKLLCASPAFLYVIFLHLSSAKGWVRAVWWCYVTCGKSSIYYMDYSTSNSSSLDWQVHWLVGLTCENAVLPTGL